jgi:hypothetical protein
MKDWKTPTREWNAARAQFAVLFADTMKSPCLARVRHDVVKKGHFPAGASAVGNTPAYAGLNTCKPDP